MSMKTERDHVSPSQVGMYFKCGLMFEYVYIDGRRQPPKRIMVQGSAVDDSVSANLTNKMITGELLPREEALNIAAEAVDRRIEAEGVADGDGGTDGECKDGAVRLSDLHYTELAPAIQPIAIQREVYVDVSGIGKILGYIDVQERGIVRDTKTTRATPADTAAETSDQLTFYALCIDQIYHEPLTELTLDYLVNLKTPKVKVLKTTRNQADYDVFLDKADLMVEMVRKGIFLPASKATWICSPGGCGFYQECKYGARKSVQI